MLKKMIMLTLMLTIVAITMCSDEDSGGVPEMFLLFY